MTFTEFLIGGCIIFSIVLMVLKLDHLILISWELVLLPIELIGCASLGGGILNLLVLYFDKE